MTSDGKSDVGRGGEDARASAGLLVRPLTHELLDDWLAFFDVDGFADNPDWSDCYCQFFHVDDEAVWECRTAEQNRAASTDMIQSRRMHGYLAYLDGRPVGWCHAAPRSQLPRIANDPELAVGDGDRHRVDSLLSDRRHRRAGKGWRPVCSRLRAPDSGAWDS